MWRRGQKINDELALIDSGVTHHHTTHNAPSSFLPHSSGSFGSAVILFKFIQALIAVSCQYA